MVPTVSVVLPVHQVGPALSTCLDALVAARPDELVVAVDGGEPAVVAAVEPVADRIEVLAERSGPAAARNRGAAAATGDVVLFVDADVAVRPDTVEHVRRAFDRDPGLDALVGSYDDDPPEANLLSRYKNLLNHHHHQRARADGATFYGACGAIRRDRFAALGGFDADTYAHPSIEDIELGYRLTDRGGRIRVDRDLQVTHLKHWTAGNLLHTDVMRRALPWAELLLARGGFQDDLNVDREHRVKVVLAGTAVLGVVALPWAPAVGATTALGAMGAMAGLDRHLVGLFHRRGGWRLAVGATAWHWASYLYGGMAFAWAALRHVAGASRAPRVHARPHAVPARP